MIRRISTAAAAYIMGCSPQFIRIGMQRGILNIGDAMKMSSDRERWTYNISPAKLAERQGLTMEELEREVNNYERDFEEKYLKKDA